MVNDFFISGITEYVERDPVFSMRHSTALRIVTFPAAAKGIAWKPFHFRLERCNTKVTRSSTCTALLKKFSGDTFYIPQYDDRVRSLNLANAASIAVYEAIRQLGA